MGPGPPGWGLGVGLITPPCKNLCITKSNEVPAGQTYLRRHSKRLKDLRLGSWNVLSLYQPGALKMLLEQLDCYKLDVTAVQELRWVGCGVMEKKDHVVFYSCQNKTHMFGTGFIVSKKKKHLVMDFQAKSHRMCRLRIKGQFFNYSLICFLITVSN